MFIVGDHMNSRKRTVELEAYGLQVSYRMFGDIKYRMDAALKGRSDRFGRIVWEFSNGLIFSEYGEDKNMFAPHRCCLTLPWESYYVKYKKLSIRFKLTNEKLMELIAAQESEFSYPYCRTLAQKLIKEKCGDRLIVEFPKPLYIGKPWN